ncbi:MAG: hypothetical protein J5760_05385, partial [Clostridia bacterium]|nr:hypothetical protein [Clostridia bacterium]
VGFNSRLRRDNPSLPAILAMLRDSSFSVSLKKRYMLKAIDEEWVKMIEDCLPALDMRIRNPSLFIEQREEVLPIELSRNIGPRSVVHLSQHTNLISRVEGDEITPSKILNVFNDETMMTYENKFVNTLINRLYIFVARRYEAAIKLGRDEKCTMLEFGGDFNYGKVKGRLKFGVEISEEPESDIKLKNYYFSTSLWHRVQRLYGIVRTYTSSEFAVAMGKAYIRPPVMHTNAILKNKNLRQCLTLWEFIESYENVGYDMLVQEDSETPDQAYIEQLYDLAAQQYMIFRSRIKNDFEEENMLETAMTDSPVKPKIISELKPISSEEFDIRETQYRKVNDYRENPETERTPDPVKDIEDAIDISLAAFSIYEENKRREREERRRAAEEAKRRAAEEAEAKRLKEEAEAAEAKRRLEEAAAELRRQEEEAKRAEEERIAREEAEKKAEEERERLAAEEEARKLAEEERVKKAAEEAIRIANEARIAEEKKKRNSMPRKKKKKIRREAEKKAQDTRSGKKELPKKFDYDYYTEYINK